ncbi:uncharacterized protein LOC142354390 [Convolutriloba macropyga]|uniref:uncharacterized protein LOC142354390 n=1 Tax=Convolutriloba macropyga TaxID=536237 RepID=UPI003F5256A1
MAFCSFNGVEHFCVCKWPLEGDGHYCSGHPKIVPSAVHDIQLQNLILEGYVEQEPDDPDATFDDPGDSSKIKFQDDFGVFMDLNELGQTSDFDSKRCAEIKRDSKAKEVGTVTVQMKNRHYIKAVGFNTRNDELSDFVRVPFINLYVCEGEFLCRNCTGGAEGINLLGNEGWNYVLCEEVGSNLKIEVNLPEDDIHASLTICELSSFGLDVSPIGRIILSIDKIVFSGFEQSWNDSIGFIIDGLDEATTDKCFQISSKNVDVPGVQEVHIFFKIPKNISHVQILAPNTENVEELIGVKIEHCVNESACFDFGSVTTASPAQWILVPLNSTSRLSESVKIIKNQSSEPFNDAWICDVEIIGKDIEPRLSLARVIGRTNKSLDLTWNLDLPDAIVEISLIPADTETQTFFTNSVKTLTELVPGTHYQIVMFPKFGETFGDYILFESGTFLGSYEFQTLFEDEVGSIFGTIKGRCSTLYATLAQQDPPANWRANSIH